jgi:hypothetical protein
MHVVSWNLPNVRHVFPWRVEIVKRSLGTLECKVSDCVGFKCD